jgi:hypothetical protein
MPCQLIKLQVTLLRIGYERLMTPASVLEYQVDHLVFIELGHFDR